jgi:holo-[acyl-carrier protein] synthase
MIIGTGIDIVDLDRFRGSMEKYGDRLLRRMFTEVEREYCSRFSSPLEHFAARFAAKEAFLKAIGTGKSQQAAWKDIEIYNIPSGQPMLRVTGRAAEICYALGGDNLHISLTHSHLVAAAMVVIEGEVQADK